MEKAGYFVSEDKTYLLESRLARVIKEWNINTISEIIPLIQVSTNKDLIQDVIDAMMTNETQFFRDDRPFKQFRNTVLPVIMKNRAQKKSLRIWSAACSTGQEPYSIAMILREVIATADQWKLEILATDLSQKALNQAKAGKYSQFEIQRGLPITMAMKYFVQSDAQWQISQDLRNMITFKTFNLLSRIDVIGTFDIILCRNVMIYFDEDTKKAVLKKLVEKLAPDGYLFLGATETIIGLSDHLDSVSECPGLYIHRIDKKAGAACSLASSEVPVSEAVIPARYS